MSSIGADDDPSRFLDLKRVQTKPQHRSAVNNESSRSSADNDARHRFRRDHRREDRRRTSSSRRSAPRSDDSAVDNVQGQVSENPEKSS